MKVNSKGKLQETTRKNCSLIQKLAIVDRARILGKKPMSRESGIAVSMIQRWTKQQDRMLELAALRNTDVVQRKRLNGNGRPSTIVMDVEKEFLTWFDFLRNDGTMKGSVRVNIQTSTLCKLLPPNDVPLCWEFQEAVISSPPLSYIK